VELVAPRDTYARDVQVALAVFAAGALLLALGAEFDISGVGLVSGPRPLFLAPLVVICTGLALRRRAPFTGLLLGLLGLAGDVILGGSLGNVLIFTQVLYEACVHGPPRLLRWALRISVALAVGAAVAGVAITHSWRAAGLGIPFALVFVLSVVTALSVRQYRDQAATERARAEQTARLAELDRRQAVTVERHRMARELHDVIANHLSAVAIHASALLSLTDLDRAAVDRSMRVIRENSVQGLTEMRQMVELLRDPGEPAEAAEPATLPARLAEADRLVARVRDAGLAVGLTITGEPRPLPVNVDLAGYRIVQESLTNALKYGSGRAEVRIGYTEGQVSLTITNPVDGGPRAAVPIAAHGAGSGLIGMRERVDLLHGGFEAGHDGAGHWRVRAELPTGDAT
jgi:signal transduction histidine kinase